MQTYVDSVAPRAENRASSVIAQAAGALAAVLGLVALLGWVSGLPLLAGLEARRAPMLPGSALLFVLYGSAVFFSARASLSRTACRMGVAAGAAGAALALLLFFAYWMGIDVEPEQVGAIITGSANGARIGLMSPVAALCFIPAGLCLVASLAPSRAWPGRAMAGFWLACLVLLAGIILLLSYLFGAPLLYGTWLMSPALTTSLAFAALGAALLALSGPGAWAPERQRIDAASLRASRSLILVFALVAAGLVAAGYVHFHRYARQERAEAERELSAIAALKAEELAAWRAERFNDAKVLSRSAVFSALVRRALGPQPNVEARRQLQDWLRLVQETDGYDRVLLLDAQGVARISVPDEPLPASASEHAREALRSGQVAFVDFHRDAPGAAMHLSLLAPIADARTGGRPLGAVVLDIDPASYLYPALRRWPVPSASAETLLIRRDGKDALVLNNVKSGNNTASSLRFPLSRTELPAVQAALGRKGIVEGLNSRGMPVVAALRPVPDSPWVLVASMDTTEFLEPAREDLWLTVGLVGALLLAAGAIVGLIWRHQRVRHYKERLRAAEVLAAGAARYRAVTQSAADAIVTADSTGAVTGWNAAAAHMFGHSESEALGLALAQLMPQRYRERHLASFSSAQAGGKRQVIGGSVELHGLTKSGAEFPLELSLSEWETAEGRFFTAIMRDISERQRARKVLTHQKDLYDMLSQTNQVIVRVTKREDLFPAVCRIAVEYGRFRFAWIGLIDTDDQQLKPVAKYGEDAGYVERMRISADASDPAGRGPAGQALRTGKHVVSNDFLDDPATTIWHEEAQRAGVRASAAFPILEGGIVVGVMVLSAGEAGFFTEDMLPTLDEMALDLSFALGNFAHEAELARAAEALRSSESNYRQLFAANPHPMWVYDLKTLGFLAVNDAAVAHYGYSRDDFQAMSIADIRPAEDLPRLRETVARVDDGKVYRAGVWRHRKKDGALIDVEITSHELDFGGRRAKVILAHDVTERQRAQQSLHAAEQQFRGLVEQSIAGIYIIQSGKFVYANPRLAEILGYAAPALTGRSVLSVVAEQDRAMVAQKTRAWLDGTEPSLDYDFVALREDGQTIDVGVHGARASHRGRPAIIGMVQDISEKKRAEEQIQHYVEQLQTALMSTVEVATTLSEMRDPYTAGHERRVGKISAAIGAELGFDKQRVEGLRIAGYLHDVGKINIPAEILSKPGKLSPIEFSLIQGHAQASYEALKNVKFPWPVAQVALQHHERMDGSGYPQALKAGAIVLEARITAVADVVEAMSSHRPYRPSLGLDKALAEIERGRGTAYDPAVADACLKLFREKGYALPA